MSEPLTHAERERGLLTLRSLEGDQWLFPGRAIWGEERRRVAKTAGILSSEFGRCRQVICEPAQTTYEFSPHSGTLYPKRRRPGGASLVVVVCTFGIATAWPLPHLSRWAPLFGGSRWTPGWWDDASASVEHALSRAARCLGDAGYAYVPDPVFDEPYDGRTQDSDPAVPWAELRWIDRYFQFVRVHLLSFGYEHASAGPRLADVWSVRLGRHPACVNRKTVRTIGQNSTGHSGSERSSFSMRTRPRAGWTSRRGSCSDRFATDRCRMWEDGGTWQTSRA